MIHHSGTNSFGKNIIRYYYGSRQLSSIGAALIIIIAATIRMRQQHILS